MLPQVRRTNGPNSALTLCVSESPRRVCGGVTFLRVGAVLPCLAILGESGPLFQVRWDVRRFEGLGGIPAKTPISYSTGGLLPAQAYQAD